MERHGARRDRILALLRAAGGVSVANVREVARETGVPEADVWGAATFYDILAHPEVERRACTGLSCRLAGASAASGHPVSCLGRCDQAPVVLGPDLEPVEAGPPGRVLPDDPELPINLGGADRPVGAALERARLLGPEVVLDEIEAAGLQGRGGASFPAHVKWRAVRAQPPGPRYVVCNADEGEPGTFKDRTILERRPNLLVEGLAIAAETVGAEAIYVYVRGEFAGPRRRLEAALAEAAPLVGHLRWHVVEGHGAYICGEETALLESIEGRRGMPRPKPPYPTEAGLWGRPTLINNVETLACVPDIVLRGGARFRALGRGEPGTRLYSLSGHVRHPGVYELPSGATLRELLAAGGGAAGRPRAFSPGGASSGFLPVGPHLDLPLTARALAEQGSMLGSAGVVVLDDTVDLAEAARWQSAFFEEESCGQCAPCRLGTRLVRQVLDRYLESGDPAHLAPLEDVAWEMEEGSICGLGMVAALPAISARRHFPEAFGPRANHGDPTRRTP